MNCSLTAHVAAAQEEIAASEVVSSSWLDRLVALIIGR